MTTATRMCATWLCEGRCTGRQKYCGDCRAERSRTQAREARRVRESMEHVGTIVPRAVRRPHVDKEDARIERIFAAATEPLCDGCEASFRVDGDTLCAECRYENDMTHGHLESDSDDGKVRHNPQARPKLAGGSSPKV